MANIIPLNIEASQESIYSDLRTRFAAYLLDGFITIPILALTFYVNTLGLNFRILSLAIGFITLLVIAIYFPANMVEHPGISS